MTLMNPRFSRGRNNCKRYIACKRCKKLFVAEDRRGHPVFCDDCKVPHRQEKLRQKYQERKLRRLPTNDFV